MCVGGVVEWVGAQNIERDWKGWEWVLKSWELSSARSPYRQRQRQRSMLNDLSVFQKFINLLDL